MFRTGDASAAARGVYQLATVDERSVVDRYRKKLVLAGLLLSAMAGGVVGCVGAGRDAPSSSNAPEAGLDAASLEPEGGTEAGGGVGADCTKYNDGGPCTPTEALFAQYDPLCYQCLAEAACLHDSLNKNSGNECHDVPANAPLTAGQPEDACLGVIACALRNECANGVGAAPCYCGALPIVTCVGAANPPGPCAAEEAKGFGTTASAMITANFTTQTYAAGMANEIFTCAAINHCTHCLGPSPDGGK
jgi:hypothetical protein